MSFILQQPSAFINAKLTNAGRKLLAQGALSYDFWVFGDSEIDYSFGVSEGYSQKKNKILAPADNNPKVKYPVPSLSNSNNIYNQLPPITPVEQDITNVAKTRGFFTAVTSANTTIMSAFTNTKYMLNGGKVVLKDFSGGTTLRIGSATTVSSGIQPQVGDYFLIGIRNPYMFATVSGLTATTNYKIFSAQTAGLIRSGETVPYLWYKIQSIVSGSLSANTLVVTVDRTLPNFSGTNSNDSSLAYFFPFASGDSITNYYGSGDTTSYWNNNTLSFESNCNVANDDVPIWNMNIVFTENIAGVNTLTYEGIVNYGSSAYTGFKQFISETSDKPEQKAIGIIHYTNHSISNYYAEAFYGNSLKLTLPTILWHKASGSTTALGNTIGLILTASTAYTSSVSAITASTTLTGVTGNTFILNYRELVDNAGNSVGKVFNDLKTVVIEDEELLMVMSYKSNRNWTVPTLNGSAFAASNSDNLMDTVNSRVYVTYLLTCENIVNSAYTTPIHCANYTTVDRGGINLDNVRVTFPTNQFPYMRASLTGATSAITGGWVANKLYMLVQKTDPSVRPDPTAWKKIDVTSAITNYASWSASTIDPADLEASAFLINNNLYTGASTYDLTTYLTLPLLAEDSKLQFGDEVFFFGNLDAEIVASAYKSTFLFSAPATMFNKSYNPTYTAATSNSVFLSEVGIYNADKELVAIGKFNSPLEKKSTKTLLVELTIDF